MNCPACGRVSATDDNFCRRCGRSLRRSGLPIAFHRPSLPVVVSQRLPQIGAGLAAIVAGASLAALNWRLSSRAALPARRAGQRPATRPADPQPTESPWLQVDEAIIIRRWVARPNDP
ncbi:MAG: zinc ribbon domain-containing protein [Dehalococcoidia bacterium]|nr:zinc ribbon domain-containing protein [Dehalococcoidia bacterium]